MAEINARIEKIIADVIRRNQGEAEFHQAVREVTETLGPVLRKHPHIWPDDITVRFMQLGSSSLDIEIMAWFSTSDFNQFRIMRQEVLLGFMEVVEKAGSAFAFPTRTVHVVAEPSARPVQ